MHATVADWLDIVVECAKEWLICSATHAYGALADAGFSRDEANYQLCAQAVLAAPAAGDPASPGSSASPPLRRHDSVPGFGTPSPQPAAPVPRSESVPHFGGGGTFVAARPNGSAGGPARRSALFGGALLGFSLRRGIAAFQGIHWQLAASWMSLLGCGSP